MKYLRNVKIEKIRNKTCVLRLGLDIKDGELKNSLRVIKSIPTLKFLLKNDCKVVIISHRGRPQEGKEESEKRKVKREETLRSFVEIFEKLLKTKISFDDSFDFKKMSEKIKKLHSKSIVIVENIRLVKGEKDDNDKLGRELASLGNFYVNDDFSTSHRKNASLCAITKFTPSYVGLQFEEEIKNLDKVLKNQRKPVVLIVGGVKLSDKVGVIKNFLNKADYVLTGGGVSNTFFAAKEIPVGDSLIDKEMMKMAKTLLKSKKIILPQDVRIKGKSILDIGDKTIEEYKKIIEKAGTIIWGGPLGYFEDKKFAKGTFEIARAILKSKAFCVIGGGETTVAFLKATRGLTRTSRRTTRKTVSVSQRSVGVGQRLFLSTGGGAMLEYLAGKKLPALEALK
ncbi:MAG: phosphoglycerate kinase [Candidatus Paceibacterota bacterium]|jgi:phosphoglycerate kinase